MATIVLADDCDDLRVVYGTCLRARGHDVHEASDGLQAVEVVRRVRPDLLLLDIWMPNRNGFDVLNELRFDAVAGQMRVAMLSVLSDGDTQLEAFGGGATEYLVKGLSLADLVEKVETMLAGSKAVCAASPA
jgi:DNA-binding response OmpR family regulator